jgi:hypothetical protein
VVAAKAVRLVNRGSVDDLLDRIGLSSYPLRGLPAKEKARKRDRADAVIACEPL